MPRIDDASHGRGGPQLNIVPWPCRSARTGLPCHVQTPGAHAPRERDVDPVLLAPYPDEDGVVVEELGALAAAPPLLRGWLLLLLLAVAASSGRLWLLWWETDY